MRYGGLRVVTALVLIGLVAFLTGGAYAAGYSAGASSTGTSVSPWIYGGAFGASHVIGFIISIFVIVLILRLVFVGAFGGHRRGPWGHRRWGNTEPSDWQRGPWYEARQAMFDDLHRRAHEAPAGPAAPGGTTPSANA
jgi:hypothetical protein